MRRRSRPDFSAIAAFWARAGVPSIVVAVSIRAGSVRARRPAAAPGPRCRGGRGYDAAIARTGNAAERDFLQRGRRALGETPGR